jgi:uncharacterized membrane protein
MSINKLLSRKETLAPLAALILASAVCVAFVLIRIWDTHNVRYGFLIWNLFLAWLPLVFALLAREKYRATCSAHRLTGSFLGWSAAWLLFFPNAPYICTDLVHLTHHFFGAFWVNLAIILSCAFTGLVLGFVSLYLMQSVVAQRYGTKMGWLFVVAMSALGSFGIYLGRFLRFNSWDVFAQPGRLYDSLSSAASQAHPHHAAFLVLFTVFFLIAYVVLYALTHLPKSLALSSGSLSETAPPAARACA